MNLSTDMWNVHRWCGLLLYNQMILQPSVFAEELTDQGQESVQSINPQFCTILTSVSIKIAYLGFIFC